MSVRLIEGLEGLVFRVMYEAIRIRTGIWSLLWCNTDTVQTLHISIHQHANREIESKPKWEFSKIGDPSMVPK